MAKQTDLSSFPAAIQAFWDINGQSMDSAMKAYTTWLGDWSRMQDESVHFLKTRLSRDLEAAAHFAACKTPIEAIDLQVRYTGNAVTDYMTEGQKIAQLLSRMARQGFGEPPHHTHARSHA